VRFEPSRFTQPFDIQHQIVISSPLCVFLESKLNVQANMIGTRNGQLQSEPKPSGRFTGERLLRERPRVYRKVVELLAEPGMSINQITKLCRVSEHTVRAVRGREAISIAERKQRLISIFGNVAEIASERMEELAGKANLRDAGTTAGIATDKLIALSDTGSQTIRHLHFVDLTDDDLIAFAVARSKTVQARVVEPPALTDQDQLETAPCRIASRRKRRVKRRLNCQSVDE
jgi:hypothetical protein